MRPHSPSWQGSAVSAPASLTTSHYKNDFGAAAPGEALLSPALIPCPRGPTQPRAPRAAPSTGLSQERVCGRVPAHPCVPPAPPSCRAQRPPSLGLAGDQSHFSRPPAASLGLCLLACGRSADTAHFCLVLCGSFADTHTVLTAQGRCTGAICPRSHLQREAPALLVLAGCYFSCVHRRALTSADT